MKETLFVIYKKMDKMHFLESWPVVTQCPTGQGIAPEPQDNLDYLSYLANLGANPIYLAEAT